MALSRETIAEVKQAADIAQIIGEKVALVPSGANFKGLCPFHAEKSPSFTVNPGRGMYHCFGCGAGGGVVDFVMAFDNVPFPEALRSLAMRYNIALGEEQTDKPRTRGAEVLNASRDYYHDLLLNQPQGEAARTYLRERGFDEDAWRKFRIGFALDGWQGLTHHAQNQGYTLEDLMAAGMAKQGNSGRPYDLLRKRVVFPILGAGENCIGFGARAIDPLDQPKYLNTPETRFYQKSKVLFGFEESRQTMRTSRRALLVEGYLDVIRLHMNGFSDAVATCGTSLTPDHVTLLERHVDQVLLVFDGDLAGLKAAMRSAPLFMNKGLEARVVLLPEGLDPDDFVQRHGPEAMEKTLQNATPLLEFLVWNTLQTEGNNLEGKERTLRNLLPLLSEIQQPTARDVTIRYLADLIEVRPEQISSMLRPASATSQVPAPRPASQEAGTPLPPPQESDFEAREGRHQVKALQILLKEPRLLPIAREMMNPDDLTHPPLRLLFQKMLALDDREFAMLSPEEMADLYPDVAAAIRHLLLKESHGLRAMGDNRETALRYEITLIKEAHKERLKHQASRARGTDQEEFAARRYAQVSKELRALKSLPGARNWGYDYEGAEALWRTRVSSSDAVARRREGNRAPL